jgi:hypothetical protein
MIGVGLTLARSSITDRLRVDGIVKPNHSVHPFHAEHSCRHRPP